MPEPLDFYFDFSSPYGYLASYRIDQLAARHERGVNWRPFLLGAVFKIAGTGPLTSVPLKGDYSIHDFQRSARHYGVPFKMPAQFPINGLQASRAYYWLEASSPKQAKPFARAAFAAYFVDGRDISSREVVADVGGEMGIDRGRLLAAMESPEVKNRLREVTDDAIQNRKVFGSPFIFVDGEPFWGADRLEMIDRWLATGGW
jgi:2-hydroxychromene-2-carboxylate isomerase